MALTEEWRPIPGCSGYEASEAGQIRSARTGAVLAGWMSGNGYLYVTIRRGGQKRHRSVHSLIAETFHGPRPDGLEVRHLNDVKTDCRAGNLRWGTSSENRHDSVRNGTHRWSRRRASQSEVAA